MQNYENVHFKINDSVTLVNGVFDKYTKNGKGIGVERGGFMTKYIVLEESKPSETGSLRLRKVDSREKELLVEKNLVATHVALESKNHVHSLASSPPRARKRESNEGSISASKQSICSIDSYVASSSIGKPSSFFFLHSFF